MPTFAPTIGPSIDSSKKKSFKVLTNNFGDGYKQRVADGINNKSEEWSLSWKLLSSTEVDEITDFFDLYEGVTPFDWVTPDGDTKSFFVMGYSRTLLENGQFSLSATLEEDLNQ